MRKKERKDGGKVRSEDILKIVIDDWKKVKERGGFTG